MTKKTITFVTSNAKKLEEVVKILGNNCPVEIVNISMDLPEVQGDIDEVSIKKCKEAARRLKKPVLVEDTALCFNAMKGLPGPYIKWFIEKLKPEGLHKMLSGWADKSAEAVCTLAYCENHENEEVVLFQGRIKGTIVAPRGINDVGFQCVFQPDGYNLTYGELSPEVKNTTSHRYKALECMRKHFMIKNE